MLTYVQGQDQFTKSLHMTALFPRLLKPTESRLYAYMYTHAYHITFTR